MFALPPFKARVPMRITYTIGVGDRSAQTLPIFCAHYYFKVSASRRYVHSNSTTENDSNFFGN